MNRNGANTTQELNQLKNVRAFCDHVVLRYSLYSASAVKKNKKTMTDPFDVHVYCTCTCSS